MKKKKVCFLADGHSLYDDRLYWKEVLSMKKNGYEVYIIVADEVDEQGVTEHGITYYKVKRRRYSSNKILNFLLKKINNKTYKKIVDIAKTIEADVYHVHDDKLNDLIQKIKKFPHRPKLIYDSREPIDKNMKMNNFDNGFKNYLFHKYADYLQKKEYKKVLLYDYILTVDDGLKKRFQKHSNPNKIEVVYNFTNQIPQRQNLPYAEKIYDAIYCGGITEERGFHTILKSTKFVVKKKADYKVLLLGVMYEDELKVYFKNFVKEHELEKNLIWIDFVRFDEVSNYYNQSKIGLNILHPFDAFEDIIQIKLFEYMNFGLPIITSNFGEMQNYVLDNEVGVAVNPFDENELAETILNLLSDQKKLKLYSENGMKAVDEKFNWSLMEEKLILIYDELLKDQN